MCVCACMNASSYVQWEYRAVASCTVGFPTPDATVQRPLNNDNKNELIKQTSLSTEMYEGGFDLLSHVLPQGYPNPQSLKYKQTIYCVFLQTTCMYV